MNDKSRVLAVGTATHWTVPPAGFDGDTSDGAAQSGPGQTRAAVLYLFTVVCNPGRLANRPSHADSGCSFPYAIIGAGGWGG